MKQCFQTYGVVFDIDGVLLRGSNTISGASQVLQRLEDDRVPYVIMTNGGGYTEQYKAEALSEKLNMPVISRTEYH